MFTEIEKAYQESLSERRFWNFYLRYALPAILVMMIFVILSGLKSWLIIVITLIYLFLLVGCFFYKDMRRVIGSQKIPGGFRAKLRAYATADNELRLNHLIKILRHHHIHSQDNLKVAIQYYENDCPVRTKTGILEWVLSFTITLASVVAIAYNDELNTVDETKLIGILWPTLRIVLFIILPMLIIGLLVGKIFFSRAKIDTILIEDLSYIYVNFDRFRAELASKEP